MSRTEKRNQVAKSIAKKPFSFVVFVILRLLVIGIGVRAFFAGAFESVFYCVLTLVLFTMPSFVERKFGIELPGLLEVIVLLFIFAAEIMGELGSYYTKVPYWDTLLHTTNGFLCAAIGFALCDIINQSEKIKFTLSPLFLTIVAFCFSMTIGVLWEFFEFFMDTTFGSDMQKDFIVGSITSTLLGENTHTPLIVEKVKSTMVNGKDLGIEGYLDIGLFDTMKDLLVNFVGAVIFSIIGYFYVKTRGKGKVAKMFIPKLRSKDGEAKDE